MCCEPVRTASGQTYWVVMEVTSPGFYGILLCYWNTSTRMNTDSCTGRAVHSGKKCWMGKARGVGEEPPPLGWHKMQALPCRTCGFKGRKRKKKPFIIALLFLSLAELLDWAEALGADLTSSTAPGPWDFNTFVFFSHQCVIVQYDGCLMLKQDRYYDLGRIFFLPMVSIFYTIFLICAEHIDTLWEYSMTNLY